MGKVKRPKPHRYKRNICENDGSAQEELAVDSKDSAIQTILDQLQAANIEEKYCALQTLSLLVETPGNAEQIIAKGVVKSAAPLLIDPVSSVRNAAAGALRNLSATNFDICESLMEHDIMTPLTFYFNEFAAKLIPDKSSKTKDEDLDTFIQSTNLLQNLCESSELAIKYTGQSNLLDVLPKYLNISTFGWNVVIATLQCLFVIVEDNPEGIQKVKTNFESHLQELIALDGNEPSTILVKTLAAGIIINTFSGNISTLPVNILNQVLSILTNALSVDHRLACNQLSSNIPLNNASGKVNIPKGKEAKELETQIQTVAYVLDAQQSAIEIIANICSYDTNDDVVDDDSDIEDDEELHDNGNESMLSEDKLSTVVLEAFVSLDIFPKIWARTQLPAQNVIMILKEYEDSHFIFTKVYTLQTRALLCINNMMSTLPIDTLGGVDGVYKIWVEVGKIVFEQKLNRPTLMEAATAVMRAALDRIKLKENANDCANLFSNMAMSDIEMMISGIKECETAEIRSNLIRMVGILALILVNNLNDVTSNVICAITDFILEQALKESEVWVLAEAIDTIVDLYSEDETDPLAAKVKLVEKLNILAPVLKSKARQQKHLPKEYKVLVSTAITNLPRFIKYKKARLNM